MYVGVDDFKKINDTHGHEFVLLFKNLNEKEDINHILYHLRLDDVKKVQIDNTTYKIIYSIGIAFQNNIYYIRLTQNF